MIVLHVLEALSSGTSRHLIDVVRYAEGVEHHVAVPPRRSVGGTDTTAVAALLEAGARLHVLDMRRNPLHPANAVAILRLLNLVRQIRPDVVHGHSGIGGVLVRALPVGLPKVYTPNGFAQGLGPRAVERLLGYRTDLLVAVSESEASFARRHRLVRADRLVVVPNGVVLPGSTDAGRLRGPLGLSQDVLLVGWIGRLYPQKAPLAAVEAWRIAAPQVPTAHFVLVGDGPLGDEVDCASAGLPRFHRLPHLEHVSSTLTDLDLFVLLSLYEGGPYAPLEAARAGVPLVLSEVVGNVDVVDTGSGVLVPQGDAQAAAAAIVDLLRDQDRRATLSRAMLGRLAERFDVRLQGLAHARLYAELSRAKSGL